MFVEKVADKRAAHSMDKQGPSLTHSAHYTSRSEDFSRLILWYPHLFITKEVQFGAVLTS